MKYWVVNAAGRRRLVVRPREHSFGHQVYELLMGLHMGRTAGLSVAFWEPAHPANAALFDLECSEVPILTGVERTVALAAARAAAGGYWLADHAAAVRQRWQRAVLGWLQQLEPRISGARAWRKHYKARLAPKAGRAADYFGLDFRVCYSQAPLTFRLGREVGDAAQRAASTLGLVGARLAVVHARESGFKAAAGGESPADAIRNARIDTYLPALERLKAKGFTVVRVGDPWMTPLAGDGIIDLATSPQRSDALELWVMLNCTLFIAGDSGPFAAALLSSAPCLAVNVTNVLGGYPVRAGDRYILKRVFDRQRGRELTIDEMLSPEYFDDRKNLERYRVIDNTPQEIAGAVEEMLELLDGRAVVSAAQRQFHASATAAYGAPAVAAKRTRKGEPAQQLLGDGLIARAFVAAMAPLAPGENA